MNHDAPEGKKETMMMIKQKLMTLMKSDELEYRLYNDTVIDIIYDNKHDWNTGDVGGDDDNDFTGYTIDNNEMNYGGDDDVENNNNYEVEQNIE